MPPALIRLHDIKLGEPSTSFFTREAETMHVQSIHPRSGGGSGGVQENTIIFIVVGIVCLFVILTGFYLVSRHAASNATRSIPCTPPQHSPITRPPYPQRERNMSEYWKIWKLWCHTSNAGHTAAPEVPTVEVSSTPSLPPRAMTSPLIILRPPQCRRITSLSVTTSFSHSHITQEALNEFRVSAYDLDGDLETEMLNSARDDVWPGHVLAVEEGCGDVGIEETMEAGNATHVIGCVQAHAVHTQWKGNDYENLSACQKMPVVSDRDSDGVGGDLVEIVEVGRVATGRETIIV